jgi:predicted short-subunit dehydrogenase-like oxidoreductase (DUF2520 family)
MAQALGRALREAGMTVAAVAGRSPERAAAAAAFIGGGALALSFNELARRAERVVIAVSDSAIETVALELARNSGRIRVALHTCGNAGPELLAALAERGVSTGAIHPLLTVHDPEFGAAALRGGVSFAVSGDSAALGFAGDIARRLGGRTLTIAPGAYPLYHAAAVIASNYITVLMDAAVEAFGHAGVPPGQALEALGPLTRAAVENALRAGPLPALTGPASRGDASTVAAHVQALAGASGPLADLYRAMGAWAVAMARRRGMPEQVARDMDELLTSGMQEE